MDTHEHRDLRQALTRIHAEYNEIPGLKLTGLQARRLWNLPAGLCEAALTSLLASGFLVLSRDGAFLKRSDQPVRIDVVQALIQTV
jgi:hypothetical protein